MKQHLLTLLLISFTLTACVPTTESPKKIADKYWQFIQTGNTTEAEKLVSANSLQNNSDNHHKINIEQFSNDEAITIVTTIITTINPRTSLKQTRTLDTVLVLEQGQWKIDTQKTTIPPATSATEEELKKLAEDLSESMQDNIESIDEAMNQGMQLLDEALRDGSKEMGNSLLELMNELNNSMHNSIDKMKQRRDEELHNKDTPPTTDSAEGMI